jgi:3-carboxy-cis,cis-muconate cycloisomerase
VLIDGSAPHEHERAAGSWHAEWEGLEGSLAGAAGAAGSLRGVLEGLEVDGDRMRENLEATRGLIMAERVRALLATRLDRADAARVVAAAAERTTAGSRSFGAELLADPQLPLGAEELAAALDPVTYLGSAGVLIDRALELYAAG